MSSQYTRMKAKIDEYKKSSGRQQKVIDELNMRLAYANTIPDDEWVRKTADDILKGTTK